MLAKNNILFFHPSGLYYGGTEKFLQTLAKNLANYFNVFFAYAPKDAEQRKLYFDGSNVHLLPFTYKEKQSREPFVLKQMQPSLQDLVEKYHIQCVFTVVFANYQFPVNALPASIPIVLLSPFGHFCTNGAVRAVYVSGKSNVLRLQNKGIQKVILDTHPLEDFDPRFLNEDPVGSTIVFGRVGRGSDQIFDPISVRAFKKLEERYPGQVKYRVVNPPPAWKALAMELGIKNMEFLYEITNINALAEFYHSIDVFAHARKDGETLGVAIVEAALAGKPVITHKSHFHNDHFDFVDKSFALWCEPDDVNQYFRNMAWMVEHKDQIRAMGKTAREKAYRIFDIKSQLSNFIKEIENASKSCSHYTRKGRVLGYCRLYWENFKAIPFRVGKRLVEWFPGLNSTIRKFY